MDGRREKRSPKKLVVLPASALREMHAAVELRQARLRERQDAIRSQLVATELDLAMTFCQVAATTKYPDRYERNIANAQEAYSAAVYFLNCNHLKSTVHLEINEKLRRLNSLLASLDRPSGPALLHVHTEPSF